MALLFPQCDDALGMSDQGMGQGGVEKDRHCGMQGLSVTHEAAGEGQPQSPQKPGPEL